MKVKIEKGIACGTVKAPPSKSMAHRLLICAAMAEGESIIHGISSCDDVSATLECLRALGVETIVSGDDVTVRGIDFTKAVPNAPLSAGESGSTLRFLIPPAALSESTTVFYGKEGLMARPMSVYEKLFNEKGITYINDKKSIVVRGRLTGGTYNVVGNVSSQFISGLLFALPLCKEDSIIKIAPPIESRSYIELTLSALRDFKIKAEWSDEHTIKIPGGQKYTPTELTVEGDYSGAAFTEALNLFDGEVSVSGLSEDSLQGDGAYRRYFEMISRGTPSIHIGDCPDLGPILFALAAAKSGGIFSGTKRLRIKESDRSATMAEELKKFGASVSVYEDTVVVYPKEFHAPNEVLYGHNDHRIVMSLAILLTLTGGEIDGAEAVNKSYPDFFESLKSLGIGVSEYDV